MRRLFVLLAAVALVAVVVVGLGQTGGGEREEAAPFDLAEAERRLAGAPGPLASLYERSNQLLPEDGFETQLADLEGHPMVINKWASWCRPCRAEFPIFQQVATERGKEIAFLGLNGKDKRPAAEEFLRERPLPYPSYEDPDERLSQDLKAATYYPITIFVSADGKRHTKAGEYTSRAELEADIDQYLE